MILVIGNDPQRVELPDLGDVVYYKQQKFFSDSQLARSADLRRALKSGKLAKLQEYGNVDQDFVISQPLKTRPATQDSPKLDLLLEKLGALEKSLSSPQASSKPEGGVVEILLERIAKLEQKIADLSKSGGDASLTEALRQLAGKVESSTKDTAILDRLESILAKAGSGEGVPKETLKPEEVYVPTVSVEDGNTHIKLDVRSVGTPVSDLDASLDALKKLKAGK